MDENIQRRLAEWFGKLLALLLLVASIAFCSIYLWEHLRTAPSATVSVEVEKTPLNDPRTNQANQVVSEQFSTIPAPARLQFSTRNGDETIITVLMEDGEPILTSKSEGGKRESLDLSFGFESFDGPGFNIRKTTNGQTLTIRDDIIIVQDINSQTITVGSTSIRQTRVPSITITKGRWSQLVNVTGREFSVVSIDPPARRIVMANGDPRHIYSLPATTGIHTPSDGNITSLQWMIEDDETVSATKMTYHFGEPPPGVPQINLRIVYATSQP